MIKIIVGAVLILAGLALSFLWVESKISIVGFGALFIPVGVAMIYFSMKGRSFSFPGMNLNKQPVQAINSFNFYAVKDEAGKVIAEQCRPEHLDNPSGVPYRSRRWKGEKYFININVPENGNSEKTSLKPIASILTDGKYHDPRTLVNAAYLPANTELAKHINDKEYKIPVWILFAVICVEVIALIIIP